MEVERGYITKEKPGKVEDTFVFRINETAYKNVQENKKIVMTGVIKHFQTTTLDIMNASFVSFFFLLVA